MDNYNWNLRDRPFNDGVYLNIRNRRKDKLLKSVKPFLTGFILATVCFIVISYKTPVASLNEQETVITEQERRTIALEYLTTSHGTNTTPPTPTIKPMGMR